MTSQDVSLHREEPPHAGCQDRSAALLGPLAPPYAEEEGGGEGEGQTGTERGETCEKRKARENENSRVKRQKEKQGTSHARFEALNVIGVKAGCPATIQKKAIVVQLNGKKKKKKKAR